MLYIQALNPPVLPRTKSALASTRAMPHCQHPTFAHPARTLSYVFYLFLVVGNLLAHALAISLEATICRFHQRGVSFKRKQGQGKLDEWQGMALFLFRASKNINLEQCPLHSFFECFLHNTSKRFLLLVFPSMPPIECSQQMPRKIPSFFWRILEYRYVPFFWRILEYAVICHVFPRPYVCISCRPNQDVKRQ